MDMYRWVVDAVKPVCEMADDVSVIHPSLMRLKTGELLLFGNTYAGNRFQAKSYQVVMLRSGDDGETWSAPAPCFAEPLERGLTPVCVTHGAGLRSGRILLVGNFGTTEAPVDESRMVPTGQISPYGFPWSRRMAAGRAMVNAAPCSRMTTVKVGVRASPSM